MKEKIKDNRVRTFEKRLRTFDREMEPKKLHLCMRIRQKAVSVSYTHLTLPTIA